MSEYNKYNRDNRAKNRLTEGPKMKSMPRIAVLLSVEMV